MIPDAVGNSYHEDSGFKAEHNGFPGCDAFIATPT